MGSRFVFGMVPLVAAIILAAALSTHAQAPGDGGYPPGQSWRPAAGTGNNVVPATATQAPAGPPGSAADPRSLAGTPETPPATRFLPRRS